MEDQILYVDSMEEVTSDENPFKKLLKKEQRLIERFHEAQEAEAIAQELFQRAQTRLQRRRKRLERIQVKLLHVREQLAELQITDQENTSMHMDVSEVPDVDGNKELAIEQEFSLPEQDTTSPTTFTYEPIEVIVESEPGTTSEVRSDEELFVQQQETTSPVSLTSELEALSSNANAEADLSNTATSEYETVQESDASSPPAIESTSPTMYEQEPITAIDAIAVEPEAEVIDSNDISSETHTERKPTKPLRVEQPGLPAAESHASDIQSAKEAWIAAESAMQNIRNAANSLATSISFLSQTEGLSSEFMEELVRKQADANRELLKAQDAARAAYERFVQAQRDTQSPANQPVDISMSTSEGYSQQKQENVSLPPAEENGLDQTAKLHAIRLYTEW